MRGIILIVPGPGEPAGRRPFEAIRDLVRRQRPECPIEIACLGRAKPALEEAVATLVAEGASSIAVFPLFIAQDGKLQPELPRLVEATRANHPHVPIALEAALGDVPEVLEGIAAWIVRRAD